MQPWMKSRQWLVTGGLFLLVLATIVGSFLTRDTGADSAQPSRGRRPPVVDEKPLLTARAMAKLAAGDELRYSYQVLRVADHEVDLAFAGALRDAANHPAPPTPQSKELYARLSKAQAMLKADQDKVDQLKKQVASASGVRHDDLQDELDLTQAQMELDQDEVDDARGDLIRSGADVFSRVQRQFNRHEASEHEAAQASSAPSAAPINYQAGHLLGQLTAWKALRDKISQLQPAREDATQAGAELTRNHDLLQQQMNGGAASQAPAQPNPADAGSAAAGANRAAVTSLRRQADDQKSLSDLNKRIQDEQELETAYGNWIALVQSHQRAALHGMMQSALWILLIVLAVYLTDRFIDRRLADNSAERTRLHTLRIILRFAVQAVGVMLILLVVFGIPQQMPTILGFAGAGLTVALKDFIVAFVGWFVLMGKNGIRVGDWVEINGVAGEVIEINLLRTVLLETGNWTDTGHPTGRKVSFVNSYAIEGHFFNFTTSGQWLWDEIQILVPPEKDPYQLVDAIQNTVAAETEANTRSASEEWQRASSRYRVRSVSAAPAVTLRPTAGGVEVHVRYITRAHERHAMRGRVYQAVVRLLHSRGVEEKATSANR